MIKVKMCFAVCLMYCMALISFAQNGAMSSFTYETTIDGVVSKLNYRTLDDATVEVTGVSELLPKQVSVPDFVYDPAQKAYRVVAVGAAAFKPNGTESSALQKVVLPASVQSIGEEAFFGNNNLENINFPQGLTWIGKSAFANCKALNINETNFPLSCDLGVDCFEGTFWLKNKSAGEPVYLSRIFYKLRADDVLTNGRLEVKEGTVQIAGGACFECTALNTLVLPSSVQRIGKVAFSGCSSLQEVYLAQVNTIDDGAFVGCSQLRKLHFLVTTAPQLGTKPVFPLKEELKQQITLEYPIAATGFDTTPWTDLGTHSKQNVLVIDDNARATAGVAGNYDQVIYSRKYSHNKWQALYLPFAMNYEDWANDFEVARLNNFHQYDDDNDGVIDRTELEVFFVRQGAIEANVPYMIRAKKADVYAAKTITIARNGGVVVNFMENGNLSCSSTTTDYTFIGSYQFYSGKGHYVMLGGELRPVDNDQLQLGGYRWRLTMADKNESSVAPVSKIKVVDNGHPSTGVESVVDEKSNRTYDVYDLSGRLVLCGARTLSVLPHGFYIVNGKKIYL